MFQLAVRIWTENGMIYPTKFSVMYNATDKISSVRAFVKNDKFISEDYMLITPFDAINGAVFEKDIIIVDNDENNLRIVEFSIEKGIYQAINVNNDEDIIVMTSKHSYETVGNIFEDKDLITGTKWAAEEVCLTAEITPKEKEDNNIIKEETKIVVDDKEIAPVNIVNDKKVEQNDAVSKNKTLDMIPGQNSTPAGLPTQEQKKKKKKKKKRGNNNPENISNVENQSKPDEIKHENVIEPQKKVQNNVLSRETKTLAKSEEKKDIIKEIKETEVKLPEENKEKSVSDDIACSAKGRKDEAEEKKISSALAEERGTDDTSVKSYKSVQETIVVESEESDKKQLISNTDIDEKDYADSSALVKAREEDVPSAGKNTSSKCVTAELHFVYECRGERGGYVFSILSRGMEETYFGEEEKTNDKRISLQGLIDALSTFEGDFNVKVYTNSQYVIYPFLKGWIHKWHNANWFKNDTDRIQNYELWEQLLLLSEKLNVKWEFTPEQTEQMNKCSNILKKNLK